MAIPRFGTDGLRGKARTEISQRLSYALGLSLVDTYGPGLIVIGRDTRESGSELEAALIAGITSVEGVVESLGVVPTPAVAWACADQNCVGVMISASHNPYEDNGLKVFAPGGLKIEDKVQDEIHNRMVNNYANAPETSDFMVADTLADSELKAGWEASVIASVVTDGGPKPFEGIKVALDCANGSASDSAPRIFAELGAEIAVIANLPDGKNINAGIGSTHPEKLASTVVETKSDIGFAFDGDADRLIAVDSTGAVIDGDRIIALLAKHMFEAGELAESTVVVTIMSNLGFHNAMTEAGIKVLTTPVGDRHVLAELEANNLSLGGEQAGHIICRNLSTSGDGILAAVQLLDVLTNNDVSLAEAASQVMKTVPQVLINVSLSERVTSVPQSLMVEVERFEQDFKTDGRVLVRPSGTEALLRIMVEHVDEAKAKSAAKELAEIAGSTL